MKLSSGPYRMARDGPQGVKNVMNNFLVIGGRENFIMNSVE